MELAKALWARGDAHLTLPNRRAIDFQTATR
jgi:hypothetical protein